MTPHPVRTSRSGGRRLLPLGVALAVLAVVAATWGLFPRGGSNRTDALPPGTVAATSVTHPAEPGTTSETGRAAPGAQTAASVAVGPTLTEAIFTGRTSGNELTLAVGVKDGHAAGYLCDGHTVEAWLEGSLAGDQLALHGRSADTGVTATVGQRSLLGSVTLGGTVRPFAAQIAAGPAGLFQSRRTVEGITTRIGWIVLPDGTQVGIRDHGTQRSPAPPLDPVTLAAFDDGQRIPVDRLSGASSVLGA